MSIRSIVFVAFSIYCAQTIAQGASDQDRSSMDGASVSQKKERLRSSRKKFGNRSLGHNVSMSGSLLDQGEVSVGTQYIAVGVTDKLSIGVSPFVWTVFDMYNIAARLGWDISEKSRIVVGAEYFKTFGADTREDQRRVDACEEILFDESIQACPLRFGGPDGGFYSFRMEAWDVKLALSQIIVPGYRLNLNASYYHYIDDARPFSLRMDPVNRDRYALNFTTLHEIRLHEKIYLNLEAGFWGLNYLYTYLHAGATLNVHLPSALLGFGLSTTWSPGFPADQAVGFAGYDSRRSIHPEIQMQMYF